MSQTACTCSVEDHVRDQIRKVATGVYAIADDQKSILGSNSDVVVKDLASFIYQLELALGITFADEDLVAENFITVNKILSIVLSRGESVRGRTGGE